MLLAWFAAIAGLISIISALTPEAADRVRLIGGVLPPGVPDAARTIALALGLGMIFFSRGLARRKRRAWYLAVAIVIASALAHLAKGLDFEEATVHLLLLVALFRSRRHFVAPGDPATVLPLVQVAAALLLAAVLFVVVMYETDDVSARIEEAGLLLVAGLGFRALWLWLRPLPVVPPCAEDRERATELVQEHGTDSLAYFALRRDKSYFFAPSGKSFLAYRVIGSTALVAGDPIGEEEERGELMSEFVRVAHTKGWRVAIAGASNEALEDYTAIGFKSMYLGDEAVIRPAEFSLEGRAIRKVRQSVSRLEKSGYEVRDALDRRRRRAICAPSCARSPRSGAARGPSAGSRWRWTRSSATRTPCWPSPWARTGESAASCSSCRRPRARATLSRRCAAARTLRTA